MISWIDYFQEQGLCLRNFCWRSLPLYATSMSREYTSNYRNLKKLFKYIFLEINSSFHFSLIKFYMFLLCRNEMYYLHLEAINSLIILMSFQMQELKPTTSSVVHLSIMNSKWFASLYFYFHLWIFTFEFSLLNFHLWIFTFELSSLAACYQSVCSSRSLPNIFLFEFLTLQVLYIYKSNHFVWWSLFIIIWNSSESATRLVERLFQNYMKNDLLPSEDSGSGIISRTLCMSCLS